MSIRIIQSLGLAAAIMTVLTTATNTCAPVTGSFNITSPSLYPETADWDSVNCKLYLSSLYNATVLEYDPYTGEQTIITFPGISGNADHHMAGVTYDNRTGYLYFDASSATAYSGTVGSNLTGPSAFIKYDPSTKSTIHIVDLANVTADILKTTSHLVGGWADIATDLSGNAYQVAPFGGAIAKITSDGIASTWYTTPDPIYDNGTLVLRWPGVFSVGNMLVMLDNYSGNITTFDTAIGPTITTYVPSNVPSGFTYNCDRFYAPPMFNNTVALCSYDGVGTVVFNSTDEWASASYVGQVLDDTTLSLGGYGTATVQIAESLYETFEWFDGGGDKSVFPVLEITSKVLALLS